ncbi:MAG: TonB-dependent receptor plug domain-containing protein, partial [Gemmatimonadota bacterium]
MRALTLAVLVGALAAGAMTPARAQVPVPLPARPPDSLKGDSARADSLKSRRDTLSATDKLLQVQSAGATHLQPLARCGVAPLHPIGARMVFDRDSIDWVAAQSVGDLLAFVPGVFDMRSDWVGMPELPNFAGRGAGSVEFVMDCVPMLPIGPDSIAFDPAMIPLGNLERIEVERSPGLLRVFLFTLRQDRQAPRTRIGVGQGDRGVARYSGSFERRYPGGMGLSIGADYLGLNTQPNNTGGGNTVSGWLQVGYVPSPHFGVQAQLITHVISRNLLMAETNVDTLLRGMKGSRTDWQLRGLWRGRTDGLGSSLDLFVAHTGWANDTGAATPGFGQFGVVAAERGAAWSAQLSAWHYSRYTALDTRLDLGWAPINRFSGSLQLVGQRHDGDRTSQWATARVGYQLPGGFNVGGTISDGHRVVAPSILTDDAQRFTDEQVTAGFNSRLLSVDAGYVRNEGWR